MTNQENGVDLKSTAANEEKKLFIETYGCQMNVADSEVVASIMKMDGYTLTDKIEDADAVFVNTCSVRDNAEQKVYGRLQYFQSLKRKKKSLIVGVLGCMAERVKEELINAHIPDLIQDTFHIPATFPATGIGHDAIGTEIITSAHDRHKTRDMHATQLQRHHIFVGLLCG